MRRQQELHERQNAEWQAEIRRLNLQYKTNLEQLTGEMEQLRLVKDQEIQRLTIQLEEQRETYELKIKEL